MRRSAFLAAVAAGVPALARAQTFGGQYARQLTLGVNVTLSGPRANFGGDVVRGVQAAIDEANRFTTPLQRSFGIRAFDDQNAGNIATTNVAIAAADPSIVAMIGNLSADVTLQALPQYANANFALIVPTVTADSITARSYRNVFRLPTRDSSEGVLIARSLLQGRKKTTAVVFTVDGDYGADVARGFSDQAKADKHDVQSIVLPASFDPGAPIEQLRGTTATFVLFCGKPERLAPIAAGLRAGGYKGDFAASDGFYTQATIDTFARALDGSLVASSLPPLERIPSIFEIFNDFSRSVGAITAFSAYGYAAAQLVIAASGRTTVPNRIGLLDTLQRTGTYSTIVGPYSFNFSGDAMIPNVYFYTVTPDGFKFAKPAIANGFVV